MVDIKKDDKGNVIRVEAKEYKEKKYLDVRHFFTDKAGELRPTKKGIYIPWGLVDAVLDAMESES